MYPNPLRITVIRSGRKTLALRVVGPDAVEVRAPYAMTDGQVQAFIRQQQPWLDRHLRLAAEKQAQRPPLPRFTEEELRALAQQALDDLPRRAARWAEALHVSYGRITVRNQKSRWGSCSGKGNLNFNCLLMLCPPQARDYVVVHELCHRKEMNHSPRFWALVEQALPDYRVWREWLKTEGQRLIERL